jgi:hypothetical protein
LAVRRGGYSDTIALCTTLTDGVLQVRQALQRTKDGLLFLPPKTARSRRVIALPRRS